ncbi:TraG/TraD/VirD4 family protein [Dyadobacter chenwenxiniae]|uniref:TraG/TraD/VirD4 family protein n=1 Tax=Dyadobacter chenwenxiniae TaxID=2906456 RepID=A0A9X1PHH5_9BACT|nr:TraM recognition domain-containing protein [Dyadobacter chenwenxiniae]MCF0061322.1 TraG/TraD/VirD4 family protein [Dyadobacter chenwenxiniae]UON81144.1 TraG/TraD/VirD4 family protein [Dyadobacter chenwenxiniae]
MPILEFASQNQSSVWTVRQAVEGVQIFGGIGSGKTSGSGRKLALKYLKAGFGGLVLTAKSDEKHLWEEYCSLTGRSDDLHVIEPNGHHSFDFLNYISSHDLGSNPITDNIVDVLKTVIRASQTMSSGKSDDAFWETALDMLIFNVIDLCQLAYGKVSFQLMYEIVLSIPKNGEEDQQDTSLSEETAEEHTFNGYRKALEKAKDNVLEQIDRWRSSFSAEEVEAIWESPDFNLLLTTAVPDVRLYGFVEQFFNDTFIPLSEKTRSIIDFSFTGFLFRMLREPIYSMFCSRESTITPEDSLRGKVILLNLPVKTYQKTGRDCQIMFKLIWQQAMEKRNVLENELPVFLWADEAQSFLHGHDADFQATARSSRIATVYISQNLPNYYACMGGDKSEYKVKSFLGTLATKIFHANADIETNRYGSELIGDAFFEDESESVTIAKEFSQTRGKSFKLERAVRPEAFVSLRTGGPANNFIAEAYIHRQGDTIANGRNYAKMNFSQLYNA